MTEKKILFDMFWYIKFQNAIYKGYFVILTDIVI